MEAKELRIGNYASNGIVGFFQIKTGKEIDFSELHVPIPLTEDWLLKLGFYSDVLFEGDSTIYILKDKDFYIDFDTMQPIDGGFPIANYKIKYVHQLQNLYFALTGEELTIKESSSA